MVTITVRGHEFELVLAKDSFSRRALLYKNSIISVLSKIGIISDDVGIDIEPIAIKNVPASAVWYGGGFRFYYSYKSTKRYVDNLYVVYKVIEFEVGELLAGNKTFEEFRLEFTEEEDVEDLRKEARNVLGVEHDVLDMNHIDKKYKDLAKKHHPDMPEGNVELFKKINEAHKLLRRELQ